MTDENFIMELLKQTDEYQGKNFLERLQAENDWRTKIADYTENIRGKEDEGGIYGIYNELTSMKENVMGLDQVLKDSVKYAGQEIADAISKWQPNVSGQINKLLASYAPGPTTTEEHKIEENDGPEANVNDYQITDTKNSGLLTAGTKARAKKNYAPLQYYELSGGKMVAKGTSQMALQKDITFTVDAVKTVGGNTYYKVKNSGDPMPTNGGLPNGYWILASRASKYARGGFVNFTGPAWLDGTQQHPEAVLNALQTEHFMKFTNALDRMFSSVGNPTNNASTISIDNISFNVESMSSVQDGEAAFNAFVNKFKEIGNQTGLKINSFKNTL